MKSTELVDLAPRRASNQPIDLRHIKVSEEIPASEYVLDLHQTNAFFEVMPGATAALRPSKRLSRRLRWFELRTRATRRSRLQPR